MKGLTVNEEPDVCRPYASRNHYDGFLPIPNSNAGGAIEQKVCLRKIAASPEMQNTTYMRSTIKRSAAATARYAKN